MRVRLDNEFLQTKLLCPPGRRKVEFADEEMPGLYIEVRASQPGSGTAYYRYRKDGLLRHYKIGTTATLGLADIRREAKRLASQVTLGGDPRSEARAKKAVITFDELITNHYWSYAKPRKRSWKRDEQLYRLRIKGEFGGKRLTDITRRQVMSFHTALANEGLAPATADHHVKLIRRVLNLAVEWGMLEKNPAAKIPLFNADNRVEHLMSDQQLQRLVDVLRSDVNHEMVCRIILFLALTGLRRSEALGLRWSDIDMERQILTIHADRSKNKSKRHIPLVGGALDILRGVGTMGKFEHVFVNFRTGRPYVEITRVWHVLRKRAGLPHLRLHDLRHQWASMVLEQGYSARAAQKWLGHKSLVTTERYLHVQDAVLRNAGSSVSERIWGPSAEHSRAGGVNEDRIAACSGVKLVGGGRKSA